MKKLCYREKDDGIATMSYSVEFALTCKNLDSTPSAFERFVLDASISYRVNI